MSRSTANRRNAPRDRGTPGGRGQHGCRSNGVLRRAGRGARRSDSPCRLSLPRRHGACGLPVCLVHGGSGRLVLRRHDVLPDRGPCRVLDRPLPGYQRECRQAAERPHAPGQPDAPRGARRERPRRGVQTRLLPRGPVSPAGQACRCTLEERADRATSSHRAHRRECRNSSGPTEANGVIG